jgi:hypothetical protein
MTNSNNLTLLTLTLTTYTYLHFTIVSLIIISLKFKWHSHLSLFDQQHSNTICYLFHNISFMTFKHHHPPTYALPNFFPIFFSLCICLHFLTFLHILLVVFHCCSCVFFCSSSFIMYFWDLTCIYVGMMLWLNCERLLDVTFVALWNKISGNPIK